MLRARLGPVRLGHPVLLTSRQFSLRSHTSGGRHGGLTRRAVTRTTLLTFTLTSALLASSIYADSDKDEQDNKKDSANASSLGSLVRAYAVYSMCSVPGLVDASPKILSTLSSVPGLKQITEAFVRITFFDQFVGADTADEAIPLLHSLRAANRGVLFAYSVEVDENEATGASISLSSTATISDSPSSSSSPVSSPAGDAHTRIVDEMLHCIDVAADFEAELSKNTGVAVVDIDTPHSQATRVPVDAVTGRGRRTWVAVKMTAMLPDAHTLTALSSHIVASRKTLPSPEGRVPFPGSARIEDLDVISTALPADSHDPLLLTPTQVHEIRELYADLHRICTRAREKGVKVIVDAEYSWYQPAIDALTLALMREFNSLDSAARTGGPVQPLVYGTFQAYLRRCPTQLALALEDARKNHYALGVKLVRGAYHPHELGAHEAALAFDKAHGITHSSSVSRPSLSISPDIEPPVWSDKRDTDEAYNHCVGVLVKAVKEDVDQRGREVAGGTVSSKKKGWFGGLLGDRKDYASVNPTSQNEAKSSPGIGVLFGTHNWDSCALILKELVRNGLAVEDSHGPGEGQVPVRIGDETVERVAIGQLYGMSDDLTDWVVNRVVSSTPFVIKYVPYGVLADVMPYLSRRAIENKSVLGDGNAAHERSKAGQELWKRVFG